MGNARAAGFFAVPLELWNRTTTHVHSEILTTAVLDPHALVVGHSFSSELLAREVIAGIFVETTDDELVQHVSVSRHEFIQLSVTRETWWRGRTLDSFFRIERMWSSCLAPVYRTLGCCDQREPLQDTPYVPKLILQQFSSRVYLHLHYLHFVLFSASSV